MWDPTGHHPCGGRVRHAVKGVRGNWIEVMGGQDNATSADEADIAMNVQGLHGEPRETRGTTIGNTGNPGMGKWPGESPGVTRGQLGPGNWN